MKKRFLILILITLGLNLIWEFSHYQLYIDLSGIQSILHLLIASFTDMLYIIGFYIIVSLKNKNISWINKPKKIDYFIVAVLGLITAITIEVINLSLGRWQYKEIMPTIFGIGLSPLVQLAITGMLALLIISIFSHQS